MPRGYPIAKPGKPVLYTRITRLYAQDLAAIYGLLTVQLDYHKRSRSEHHAEIVHGLAALKKRVWKRYREAQRKLQAMHLAAVDEKIEEINAKAK